MEEVGIVKEIIGPKARVAVQKQSSCESCPGGSVCTALGGGEASIEAVNDAGAQVGDTVRVAFTPYTYLKGTALIYGIPSIMLIVGAVLGKEYLSGLFPGRDPDLMAAVGGFGLFALTFLLLKLWSGRAEGKREYTPVITEIVSPKP